MDTDTTDELDLLRARAYGPAADIHTDVSAQQRLRELEALTRARDSATDASSVTITDRRLVEAPPARDPGATSPLVPEPEGEQQDEPAVDASALRDTPPPPRGRLSRTVRLLWAGSIVATAAVTAACTYGLSP